MLREPRYSKEEHARRGEEIYRRLVRPSVEPGEIGRVAAIDVETEQFETAEDTLTASDQLLARLPDAQIWFVRIGEPTLHRIGPRR